MHTPPRPGQKNKTTVENADEWYSVFSIENYSCKSVGTVDGKVVDEAEFLCDSDKIVITDKNTENNNVPVTFYRWRIGDKWYDVDMNYSSALTEKNVGVCDFDISASYNLFADMFENGDIKAAFSKATYDENKKAYLYSYSTHHVYEEEGIEFNYSYEYEFYIVDKKLKKVVAKVESDDFSYSNVIEYYNIGTTTVKNMPSVAIVGIPETIPDRNHTWTLNSNNVVSAEGCDGIGKVSFVCSDCSKTLELSYINGHSEETYATHRLAEGSSTCEDGIIRIECCKRCDGVLWEGMGGNYHAVATYDYCDLSGYDVCESHEVGKISCACDKQCGAFFDDEIIYWNYNRQCNECGLRMEATREVSENGGELIQTTTLSIYFGEQHVKDFTIVNVSTNNNIG